MWTGGKTNPGASCWPAQHPHGTGLLRVVAPACRITASSLQEEQSESLCQQTDKRLQRWFQAPLAYVPAPTPQPFLENGERRQAEKVLLNKPRVTVELAGAGFYCKKHQKQTLPCANPT